MMSLRGVSALRRRAGLTAGPSRFAASRPRGWVVLAVGVLVVGVTASVCAGVWVARSDADRSRQEFERSATAITSALRLSIQHEVDLVVNTGAFLAENPDATQEEFAAWVGSARVLERFPELIGLGHFVLVTDEDLGSYAAEVAAGSGAEGGSDEPFEVIPSGDRPFYCFGRLGIIRGGEALPAAGYDVCAGATGDALLEARDSGRDTDTPMEATGGLAVLSWKTPLYRGGQVPETVEGRREAFLGWADYAVDPQVVLATAMADHPGMAVALSQGETTFRRGDGTGRSARSVTDLGGGWSVAVSGDVETGGVLANPLAFALMAAGTGATLLLAILILVLATGRSRALSMVKRRTDELQHQALHDGLTGLPNRALIVDRLEQLLARSRRHGTSYAVMFLDLDSFKDVNDTLGHDIGDELLRAVAARLTTTLRDVETVGRLGGDEFVVLIDGGELEVAPALVAERLIAVMREPFTLPSAAAPVTVTVSIGISVEGGDTPVDVLRDADMALYAAKAAGRDRYEIFHPEMESALRHRYTLEVDLRTALDDGQFRLVYQPIYELSDLTVVGVEALLRWDHPILGEVQPDDFIPLLETSGHIVEVGRWVLDEACRQMAEWRDRGSDLVVAVNVSGRQLDHDDFVGHVRQALSRHGVEPGSLTLEITETALMRDIDGAVGRLEDLKALGVKIAIDDFGTGYCSLAYLQRLAVDSLKIDRTFTGALTTSAEADALVHTIVRLCADLGLKALAEGVETTGQIDHLRGEDVTEVQGFLLAHPLRPEAFEPKLLAPSRPTGREHGAAETPGHASASP